MRQADAVTHTTFSQAFTKLKKRCKEDRRVICILSDILKGANNPLNITSGTGLVTRNPLKSDALSYL
ncbi:MAG: hypothetical protein RR439_07620 [Carnobacterium sp.]